jgi:hypothetical protein
LSPLTLRTANGARVFTPHDDMLLIHPAETKPETLKRGQTVLVHSVTGPTADGSLQAMLVAVSPKPRIKPRQQRRLILRERGPPGPTVDRFRGRGPGTAGVAAGSL